MDQERVLGTRITKGKAIKRTKRGGAGATHRLKVTGIEASPASSENIVAPPTNRPSKKARDSKDDLPHPAWSVRYKEPFVTLSADRMIATGCKGWASVLLTHGANYGCWYFEVILGDGVDWVRPKNPEVNSSLLDDQLPSDQNTDADYNDESRSSSRDDPREHPNSDQMERRHESDCLGPLESGVDLNFTGWTGAPSVAPHLRVGWGCRYCRFDVPVATDQFGICLRDLDATVIHMAKRQDYGKTQLGRGSVIGCGIVLGPPAYRLADPRTKPELHPFLEAGLLCDPERPPRAVPNEGSSVEFLINGRRIGPAAVDLPNGTYHPAVSLYMGSQCRINLGPEFVHPPPPLPSAAQDLTGFSMYHPASRLPRPDF